MSKTKFKSCGFRKIVRFSQAVTFQGDGCIKKHDPRQHTVPDSSHTEGCSIRLLAFRLVGANFLSCRGLPVHAVALKSNFMVQYNDKLCKPSIIGNTYTRNLMSKVILRFCEIRKVVGLSPDVKFQSDGWMDEGTSIKSGFYNRAGRTKSVHA